SPAPGVGGTGRSSGPRQDRGAVSDVGPGDLPPVPAASARHRGGARRHAGGFPEGALVAGKARLRRYGAAVHLSGRPHPLPERAPERGPARRDGADGSGRRVRAPGLSPAAAGAARARKVRRPDAIDRGGSARRRNGARGSGRRTGHLAKDGVTQVGAIPRECSQVPGAERGMSHPSDLKLERHLLDPGQSQIGDHVSGCELCQGRLLAMRQQGEDFRRFVYPATLHEVSRPRWRPRQALWLLAPAAGLATVLLVTRPGPPADYVGSQGQPLELTVYVARDSSAHALAGGAAGRARPRPPSACGCTRPPLASSPSSPSTETARVRTFTRLLTGSPALSSCPVRFASTERSVRSASSRSVRLPRAR